MTLKKYSPVTYLRETLITTILGMLNELKENRQLNEIRKMIYKLNKSINRDRNEKTTKQVLELKIQ